MAIKNRIPKSEHDKKEMAFVEAVEQDNLKALTLEQLAYRFEEIEQQGQLLQGRILLEARERFKSDKEFGQWCTQSICLGSQPQRTRLINLARFFEARDLAGIGISAAYEISAPINADIAEEIYEYAKGKNLPVAEVKKQIAKRKGESLPLPVAEKSAATEALPVERSPSQSVTNSIEKTKQDLIMEILQGLTDGEKRHVLNDCLKTIPLYPSR
jgi:hypothetical protein